MRQRPMSMQRALTIICVLVLFLFLVAGGCLHYLTERY